MTDLFNNISNDYINPDLAPCAGGADDYFFEFLPGQQAGIVSGASIIAAMALGDISQPVVGWVQQTKVLQPGEVTFIQGMTKGITNRTQYFPFDPLEYNGELDQYYMSLDISINYYKNFRYYEDSIFVTGDYDNGITIENALDIEFDARGIKIESSYDPSGLTFTGSQAGYSYDIKAIDVSLFLPDASVESASLIEDVSSGVPAFKYPNGAMLGYVLKVTYPTSSSAQDYDKYIKINHVPDYLEYFTESDTPGYYERHYDAVDVGLSGTGLECFTNVLSAADYLDKVETNNMWEKVGVLRIWLTAEDPVDSAIENLITGFYVFNPQSFAVKIDYMTIL